MTGAPLVTIFTPTYNRAHTLPRVFESLRNQTMRDLEWLVIDDGSTDATRDLIEGWVALAGFPVRYIAQQHAGKHVAYNRALTEARGQFFTCLDSDDALLPDGLEKLVRAWGTIPAGRRHEFYSVDALCCDQHGNVIGNRFPAEPLDADLRELKYVYRMHGEKLGLALTEVVRRYPFPDLPGAQFIPEGVVWSDIAKKFKSRCVNDVVRIYYTNHVETGPTLSGRRSLGDHALGRWHYYVRLLNDDIEFFARSPVPFFKAAVMLPIVALHSGQRLGGTLVALKSGRATILFMAVLPFSALLYIGDLLLARRRRASVNH
jgi:glycosyltransferase involved in cell wall biosynthesis